MRVLIIAACVAIGCAAGSAAEKRRDCRSHDECQSKVCSHYKKDNGTCAPTRCSPGERADNNHFYCDAASTWHPTKREGQACAKAWECYAPNCYMDPMCDTRPRQHAECKQGKCVLVAEPDACGRQGKVRILAPEEYSQDGSCMQSMAQRILRTVCAPCGNGVCDPDESVCNCPRDCKAKPGTRSPAQSSSP